MPVLQGDSQQSGQGLSSLALPLAMPVLPAFGTITVTFDDTASQAVSPFTKKRQVQDWNADILQASVQLPGGMMADTARAWVAFLAACRGIVNSFLLGDTSQPFPRGSAAGNPVVDGASQTGRQLVTRGWTPNSPLVLRSGDWIQIGTGLTQRLHMNLLDVSADSSGRATLNVYPRLRESPGDGGAIVTNRPMGCFALATTDRKYSVDSALVYGISFDAVEAL